MKKICKIIVLLVIIVFTAILTNFITLQYLKINIVNKNENVIEVTSFGQNWIYEF